MKKTALAVVILVTAALAGCHHNKPAASGGDMGAGSGSAMGSGDMGSGGAPAGGTGGSGAM